ncbi:hypothetical protein Lepto7376_3830 [[Leptolyngbya] sp. PCC 7376]|uniref:DUF5991 domain-containing protein n=1 Tax=[Leptolyngbya] sp. PCC 7376 TaxID=111781 RepID=UPI00029F23B5|nr:DUF5991 domain-containing protein [[Leptolyngbya] sp. PCC 7376]AFY39988.1 hypothetical protein Lepto7376_3830 [[Leptolyngbya] sp. PCC 7376]
MNLRAAQIVISTGVILGVSFGCAQEIPESPSATTSEDTRPSVTESPEESELEPKAVDPKPKTALPPQTKNPVTSSSDGLYFYGEVPTTEALGKEYLLFRQEGTQVIGWNARWATDDRSCLRGQRQGDKITNIETAIAPLGPSETWVFSMLDDIPLSNYSVLPTQPLPEGSQGLLDDCVKILEWQTNVARSPNYGLNSWVGNYTFSEATSSGAPQVMAYQIDIFGGEEQGRGKVSIDGQMTAERLIVEVRPESPTSVGLYFQEHTGEFPTERSLLKPGDRLFGIELIDGGNLQISWDKWEPLIIVNQGFFVPDDLSRQPL